MKEKYKALDIAKCLICKFNNEGKTILIVSHHTAIIFLLKKWCSIKNNKYLLYKDKVILENGCRNCETVKLLFKDGELIEIENMEVCE